MRISASHTVRYLASALAIIGLAPAAAFAAGGLVGEWDLLVLAEGTDNQGTLTIVEEDGKYSGTLVSDAGVVEISEVNYEDGELSFTMEIVDFGMSLAEAMSAPRIINRVGPTELETQLFEDAYLKRELERRGHPVVHRALTGNVQAIFFDVDVKAVVGESDPRGEGVALGY